ncbi:hypothetical protein CLOM_g20504 [Closterium sp. NIES-68]|nr:hypothetical protein CLOM_g20504 [Closterium sp. NIES-68]GJP58299.1 hypothetical protein CLOP_g23181 [Closterium sp. NIES-67]
MKLGNTRLMSIASIAAAMGKSGCCSSFTGICSNMVFRAPHRLPLLPSVRGQTEPAPAPEESQAAWSYLQVEELLPLSPHHDGRAARAPPLSHAG